MRSVILIITQLLVQEIGLRHFQRTDVATQAFIVGFLSKARPPSNRFTAKSFQQSRYYSPSCLLMQTCRQWDRGMNRLSAVLLEIPIPPWHLHSAAKSCLGAPVLCSGQSCPRRLALLEHRELHASVSPFTFIILTSAPAVC